MASSGVEITFDRARIDFDWAVRKLRDTYWGSDRSEAVYLRAFEHSLCAAAFDGARQVGFGRAMTDRATMAYLCDVFVDPQWRGQAIGSKLVAALLDHPDLTTVTSWSLRTTDAHGLYERFGFQSCDDGAYMRLTRDPG